MMDRFLAAHRPLFVLVIFTGSFLLFLIQPMVARMALPLLGGAPNVWNSAMLVFQALLLGGYAYAHALARLPLRRQAAVHLALLAMAALTLPIALAGIARPAAGWEVLWVPALFALTVGPVFMLVSAQAPLMQRWYAAHPQAGNPYALYAASNLGSFAGLLTYPLWLEPRMALGEQSGLWTAGYALLIVLVAALAMSRWNKGTAAAVEVEEPAARPTARQILLWIALAAVPSGLMLSTTSLLTTDLMAMPLLWVIPLGFYLLSFSLAFSDSGDWSRVLTRMAPVLLLLVGSMAMISGGQANPATAIAMVGLLFVLAVALHARLYDLRPHPRHLTLFYLVVAAGGALGGAFTAIIAPVLFDWIYEHPILLIGAALLLPAKPLVPQMTWLWEAGPRRRVIAACLLLVAVALMALLAQATLDGNGARILAFILALTVLGVAAMGNRAAYVAVVALLMLGHGGIGTLRASVEGDRTRSYFGVYTVEVVDNGRLRQLSHGTTVHGRQWLVPSRRTEPTTYYGPSAGVGIALAAAAPDAVVGIVGLGAGTLACYRQPGQQWAFFEIDPQVARYSEDGTFTFLADCTPDARMVIGDARLELAEEPEGLFDVLAIDAFSSDSIPMHLMTAEAFATYQRVMDRDGLLLLHVSNRFIDLAPMISAVTQATGWHGLLRSEMEQPGEGLTPSVWIALARTPERLDALEQASTLPWTALPPPARRAWTDDNASILPLIRW
jgi:hypothetical protein